MQVEVSGVAAERLKLLVERGGFSGADDVVAAAIESLWLESETQTDELEELIGQALEDVEAGRLRLLTRDLASEISAVGRGWMTEGQSS